MIVRLTSDERWPWLIETQQLGEDFEIPEEVYLRWKAAQKAYNEAERGMFKAMGWDRYID